MLSNFAQNALSTTNAGAPISLATIDLGTARCRSTGLCNDNGNCYVEFNVNSTLFPVGSYFTVANKVGTADVIVIDSSTPVGQLEYRENNNSETITFDLQLRNSAGDILKTTSETISHSGAWAALASCQDLVIDTQSADGCYSCVSFTVNCPVGESRRVIVTSGFEIGGNAAWAAGFCNTGADFQITADLDEIITATKSYDTGIDVAQGGSNPYNSVIAIQVRNPTVATGSYLLSRNHDNINC